MKISFSSSRIWLPCLALAMGLLSATAVSGQSSTGASDSVHFNLESNTPDQTVGERRETQAARRALVESIRGPSRVERASFERDHAQWDGLIDAAAYERYDRRGFDPYEPPPRPGRGRHGRDSFGSYRSGRSSSMSLVQRTPQTELFEVGPGSEEIIRGPEIVGEEYGLLYDTGLYAEPYAGEFAPRGGCDCLGCRAQGWLTECRSGQCDTGCLQGSCIGLDNAAVFGGVHAFKGPLDDGQYSNFGFQQGFNLGGALPNRWLCNLGYQIGFQATQSQLSGNLTTDDRRHQNFLTLGLFNRDPAGYQYGIAFDWLNDDYHETHNLTQVRLEGSMVTGYGREFGVWTALGTNEHTYTGNGGVGSTVLAKFAAVDQFAFFYRWRVKDCGRARLWAGFTGQSEGLLGGDLTLPLSDRWAIQSSVNYLIPKSSSPPHGVIQESWNLGFNVVWYFGCKAKYTECCSPYRPMFNVADNGTFFVDRTEQRRIDD